MTQTKPFWRLPQTLHIEFDSHDDVIKRKHIPRYWSFVRGIHRSPVNSPHKDQWRGALMFSLICTWTNNSVNNRDAEDLRRYRTRYDVTVMEKQHLLLAGPNHTNLSHDKTLIKHSQLTYFMFQFFTHRKICGRGVCRYRIWHLLIIIALKKHGRQYTRLSLVKIMDCRVTRHKIIIIFIICYSR